MTTVGVGGPKYTNVKDCAGFKGGRLIQLYKLHQHQQYGCCAHLADS